MSARIVFQKNIVKGDRSTVSLLEIVNIDPAFVPFGDDLDRRQAGPTPRPVSFVVKRGEPHRNKRDYN